MKSLRTPLLLFALPAVLIALAPGGGERLLLQPDVLATRELWRLWSGHWVHFSFSHLAWNLAVVLAAGWQLETLRPGLLLRHTLLAAPGISAALLLVEPDLAAYGGLSGVATGLVTLLGLQLLGKPGERRLGGFLLAVVGVKILLDSALGLSLFAQFASTTVRPSAVAHIAGALGALLHVAWLRVASGFSYANNRPPSPRFPETAA